MKTSKHLVQLVVSALLAAICCVCTMVIQISTPTGGYVNLGDCVILLASCLLSPVYAMLSAGIGSLLADVLAGYAQYALATFIIKALMALVACLIFSAAKSSVEKHKVLSVVFTVTAGIAAEAVMITGYFLFEAFVLSYGMGAVASVLPNTVQGVAGVVGGTLLCEILSRTKIKNKLH